MEFEMQSPLEQLWAILNFSPETQFTTVGEVEKWYGHARAAMAVHMENLMNASAAIDGMLVGVDRSNKGGRIAAFNLEQFKSTMTELTNMVIYCWERDCIALEVFLDLPAGADPSLN